MTRQREIDTEERYEARKATSGPEIKLVCEEPDLDVWIAIDGEVQYRSRIVLTAHGAKVAHIDDGKHPGFPTALCGTGQPKGDNLWRMIPNRKYAPEAATKLCAKCRKALEQILEAERCA